jgi:hypothetical protein
MCEMRCSESNLNADAQRGFGLTDTPACATSSPIARRFLHHRRAVIDAAALVAHALQIEAGPGDAVGVTRTSFSPSSW